LVIRGGRTAILMLGAGGVLSGCALPFAGPLAFTDILTGVSIFSTAATGKGTTEIALDVMTGKDCRFLEGALREDRDICEEPGSAATDEDFKGLVAWLEDNEPASPVPGMDGEPHIMVADIGLPDEAPQQPVYQLAENATESATEPDIVETRPRTVALASLSELPDQWTHLASAQYGPEFAELGAIAPASGASRLIRAKLDGSAQPFTPAAWMDDGDLADWAVGKLSVAEPGIAERAFTWPSASMPENAKAPRRTETHWDNLWPAVDIVNPPLQLDALMPGEPKTMLAASAAPLPPAPAKPVLQALLPPAPAKPMLQALLPHPRKPVLQAALPGHPENARAKIDFPLPAPNKPRPAPQDGPVLALLPSGSGISRTR
jgi:hypothetical protein